MSWLAWLALACVLVSMRQLDQASMLWKLSVEMPFVEVCAPCGACACAAFLSGEEGLILFSSAGPYIPKDCMWSTHKL